MKLFKILSLAFLSSLSDFASAADLYCWIVGDSNGGCSFTEQTVSNMVAEVNQIYSQVAMTFEIKTIVRTNDNALASIDLSNEDQKRTLCSVGSNTGGLEVYFVKNLIGSATAVHRATGVIVGPGANGRTLGHEFGHACGLRDVYDRKNETSLRVMGLPTKERMPDDFGWYPTNVTQAVVLNRLVMYGFHSTVKADISYGDIYGLYYTSSWNRVTHRRDKHWMLGQAPVGFGLHGNRNPVSQ